MGTNIDSFERLDEYSKGASLNFFYTVKDLISKYFPDSSMSNVVQQIYFGEEAQDFEPSLKFTLEGDKSNVEGIAAFLGNSLKQNSVIVIDPQSENPNGGFVELHPGCKSDYGTRCSSDCRCGSDSRPGCNSRSYYSSDSGCGSN